MADIELVIKISKEDFEIMKHNVAVDNPLCPLSQKEMVTTIANGIPLPKHHGRIADLSAVYEDICSDINAMTRIGVAIDGAWLWAKLNDAIDNAPTIIEGSESENDE